MKIGEKIRELRKKNNLTQEKLAELLGVSFQAISKWENDLNTPDLLLIAPLTRIFHITADELLGLAEEKNDERLAYFEDQYVDFWKRSDHEADLELAKIAAAEYPQNARFQHWLASDEFYTAYNSDHINDASKENYTKSLESSLKHDLLSYELADEQKTKYSSLHGIVMTLTLLDRLGEARGYAELMPVEADCSRDDLIVLTMRGEEKRAYRQKMIFNAFRKMLWQLYTFWKYEEESPEKSAVLRETYSKIIETVIPDGNYLVFGNYLFNVWMSRAYQAANEGDVNRSVHDLLEAKKFAEESDRLDSTESPERFTCPMFDSYEYNGYDPKFDFCYLDFWRNELNGKGFDTIRSEPAFQKLLTENI